MTRANELYIDQDDDEYLCRPCNRWFSTLNGALNHCRNAAVHSGEWCNRCEWLFVSPAAYNSHEANSSRHNICHKCNLDYTSFDKLEDHKVEVHHQCTDCGLEFSNDNNLQQHKRVHLSRDVECLGCSREFSEFAAMILHLESGNCECGVDNDDIDNYIFDDYNCEKYRNEWMDYYRFCCPTCDTNFRFASGLLQHVASQACRQNLAATIRDFERCIEKRI